ncbi:hypothetical protein HY844_02155 [Candidatus Berkelbacteria bacterium]|nr:hypothetical protein [Candidatus Berkelbacteria bacterium]
MIRVIRNTVFTILVIWLSALGIKLNHNAQTKEPTSLEKSVLAASNFADNEDKTFELEVNLENEAVKLGQVQTANIKTLPNAQLEIVVLLPTNEISSEFSTTATADSSGNYQHKIKLSNFKYLGLIQVTVVARVGNKSSEDTARYVLQAWSLPQSVITEEYSHPLIP